jgi:hypothetical protein
MKPNFAPKLRPNLSRRRPRKGPSLDALVWSFALQLTVDFGLEIEHELRAFRKRVLRLLGVALPVKNGRPQLETVTRAVEMRAQGSSWRAIYTVCVPHTVAGDSRQLAQSRLRSAVRARRRRRIKSRNTRTTLSEQKESGHPSSNKSAQSDSALTGLARPFQHAP